MQMLASPRQWNIIWKIIKSQEILKGQLILPETNLPLTGVIPLNPIALMPPGYISLLCVSVLVSLRLSLISLLSLITTVLSTLVLIIIAILIPLDKFVSKHIAFPTLILA